MFDKPINSAHQEAYDYLTDWMYTWREPVMHLLANTYRDGDPGVKVVDRMEIANMVEYNKGDESQKKAMADLASQYKALPDDVRDHFESLFYGELDPVTDGDNVYEHKGIVWTGAPRPEYESQNNNPALGGLKPWNTCNCSSTAMMLRSLELKGVKFRRSAPTDEEIVRWVYDAGYNASTDHNMMNKVCYDKLGAKFRFLYDANYDDLDKQIVEESDPVVLGILHKGHWSDAYGGHMLCLFGKIKTINGKTPEKTLYIGHDPFGNPPFYDNYDGADVTYDVEKTLKGRWQVFGQSAGWMRVFDGVDL